MFPLNKFSLLWILFVAMFFHSCDNKQKDIYIKDLSRIESTIALPEGAYSLLDYDRYYSVEEVDGIKKLKGMYLYKETKNPKIHWVEPGEIHMMKDGGCAVVRVEYDLVNKKLLNIYCNGDA